MSAECSLQWMRANAAAEQDMTRAALQAGLHTLGLGICIEAGDCHRRGHAAVEVAQQLHHVVPARLHMGLSHRWTSKLAHKNAMLLYIGPVRTRHLQTQQDKHVLC